MAEAFRSLDSRFTVDADGSNYYVVFCARRSDNVATKPGHAFVVWGKEDTGAAMSSQRAFGFYPEEGNGLKAIFATVPGKLTDEAIKATPSNLLTARIIVRTNKQAFEASQSQIEKWKTSDYNLYERNCISFAKSVAMELSLKGFPPDTAELPPTYFERLITEVNTAFGGNWKSTDAPGRFRLKIAGPNVEWTEYGTGSLTKSSNATSASSSSQLRIERPNTDDVLTFLGFSNASLRAEILAKGPAPSFILLKRDGNKCVGEWHGLLVKKLANGHLDQIIQPGQNTPKFFDFTEA